MTKKVRNMYRKEKNNTSSFLNTADKIVYALILSLTAYVFMREKGYASYICGFYLIINTAVLFVLFSLLSQISLDRFINKKRKEMLQSYAKIQLCLMQNADLQALCQCEYVLQSMDAVSIDMLLEIFRQAIKKGQKDIVIYTLSPLCNEAKNIIDKTDILHAEIKNCDAVIEKYISDNCLDDAFSDSLFEKEFTAKQAQKSDFFKRITKEKKPLPYFSCGAVLFTMSFIMKFSLFYRLIGCICLYIGAICLVAERKKHSK